jgi:tetratricopeptide (TPR) repeat protein
MLEKNGQTQEAYDKYFASLSEQGQFSLAGENAGRVLLASETPQISKMTDLVDILTTKGDTRLARNLIYDSLSKWGDDTQSFDLLSSLVRLFTEVRVDLNAFRKKEMDKLESVVSTHAPLKAPIKAIFQAYLSTLKPDYGINEFSSWADGGKKSERFSSFLKMIGDEFFSTDASQALSRYLKAWQLKPDDTDAALKAANVLSEYSLKVDPEGEILKSLIARLFDAKMGAYAEGNLEDIVRLHTVLGTIYEAQGNWGTEDSGNPSSALFQWEHAKINEEKLREKDPSMQPSPGIYAHLANCYDKVGNQQRSQDLYLSAAELFIKQGNAIEAERILNQVEPTVSPDQKERWTQAKNDLEKLKAEPVRF